MNGISVLIGVLRNLLLLSALHQLKIQYNEKLAVCNPQSTLTRIRRCWHPDLRLPASRNMRNK